MTPCWGRALWIASATARTSSSSRVSLTANAPQWDRHRKSARKPRAELWGTSRKCSRGFLTAIFFALRGRNGLSLRNQANEGRADDERGTIVVPTSIGHLNYFTVLVFARNAEAVGWKQFKLVHAAAPEP